MTKYKYYVYYDEYLKVFALWCGDVESLTKAHMSAHRFRRGFIEYELATNFQTTMNGILPKLTEFELDSLLRWLWIPHQGEG